MLDKNRLFVHPKISNPNTHTVPGYWWTSAAFRSTPKTRVVAPFNLTLIEGCDFNRKNPDFLFKNPDFLIRNLDFLLKNVDFTIK